MAEIRKAKKISIIGGPGTGKSTLARNLGKELNLPTYHIDGIHHTENWGIRDKEERDKIILGIVNENKWVIDGTYRSTLEARIEKADLVIFLNYTTIAKLKGILTRYLKNIGKEREEIPGCKEKMDWEFITSTIKWNKTRGVVIKETLDKNKNKPILVFKNRRKLNKWYKEEFNKKIEV